MKREEVVPSPAYSPGPNTPSASASLRDSTNWAETGTATLGSLQQELTGERAWTVGNCPPQHPRVSHCPKDGCPWGHLAAWQLSEMAPQDTCKLSEQQPGAGPRSSQAAVLTSPGGKLSHFGGQRLVFFLNNRHPQVAGLNSNGNLSKSHLSPQRVGPPPKAEPQGQGSLQSVGKWVILAFSYCPVVVVS